MKLYAPTSYWEATEKEKAEVCNGCGAKEGMNVPDTMWGLDISQGCNIHDWMFGEGKTQGDFFFANAIFIMNLAIIIIAKSNKWLVGLRLARASKYFTAVAVLGLDAYWVEGKTRNIQMNITYKGEFRNA